MEILTIFNSIAIIYLVFQISTLKKNSTQKSSSPTTAQNPTSQVTNLSQTPIAITPQMIASSSTDSIQRKQDGDSIEKLVEWLRNDWMLKLGGLFILLAVSWFLTYAFMNNWIGETGRVVLGILFGSSLMAYGSARMSKYIREGEVHLAVGAILITTSIFVGQHSYALYGESLAMFAMAFVAFAVAFVAYMRKTEALAVIGVFMIGLTPLLAGYENTVPNVPGLLTYLIIMILGVIWLSKVTSWRSINILATFISAFYFFPYCFQFEQYQRMTSVVYNGYYQAQIPKLVVDVDILRFFAIIFSVIFNMSSFFTLITSKVPKRSDFQLILMSAIFVALSIATLGSADLMPVKLSVIAIAYMALAFIASRQLKNNYYIELYSTISILFLVWATVKAVNLDLIPMSFAIEAIILTIFYDKVFGKPYSLITTGMYIATVMIGVENIGTVGTTWQSTINYIAILSSSYFPYIYNYLRLTKKPKGVIESISLIGGNLIAFFGFMNALDNIGRMLMILPSTIKVVRYTTFSILGSFIYFASRTKAHAIKYWFGIGFIIYVVASLLLIEVWSMDIVSRIIVFFSIGILFMSSIIFTKFYESKSQ